MSLIAGASQYVNAARLSNLTGQAAGGSSLLDSYGSANSLLNAGKRINRSGIGMSASSRQQLDQFLNNSQGVFNSLLSAGVASGVDALQTQVLALRSSLPASMISEYAYSKEDAEAIGGTVDEEA